MCAGNPSRSLKTVAFVGTHGKTTAAWLTRGLLEETGALTGMIGVCGQGVPEACAHIARRHVLPWAPATQGPKQLCLCPAQPARLSRLLLPPPPSPGTIEYAIAEDRLDEEGALWAPEEDDPSADRESSSPFHILPYEGKYG